MEYVRKPENDNKKSIDLNFSKTPNWKHSKMIIWLLQEIKIYENVRFFDGIIFYNLERWRISFSFESSLTHLFTDSSTKNQRINSIKVVYQG